MKIVKTFFSFLSSDDNDNATPEPDNYISKSHDYGDDSDDYEATPAPAASNYQKAEPVWTDPAAGWGVDASAGWAKETGFVTEDVAAPELSVEPPVQDEFSSQAFGQETGNDQTDQFDHPQFDAQFDEPPGDQVDYAAPAADG